MGREERREEKMDGKSGEERRKDGKFSPAVVPSSAYSSGGVLTSSDLISSLNYFWRETETREMGKERAFVASRGINTTSPRRSKSNSR
jgi:hypothetical protein